MSDPQAAGNPVQDSNIDALLNEVLKGGGDAELSGLQGLNPDQIREKIEGLKRTMGMGGVEPFQSAAAAQVKVFAGVSLGAHSSVSASSSTSPMALSVDVNDLSNRSTPTMVGYDGQVREVGESCESRVANAINTVPFPHLLVGIDDDSCERLKHRFRYQWRAQMEPFTASEVGEGKTPHDAHCLDGLMSARVKFDGNEMKIPALLGLATYLKQIGKQSVRTQRGSQGEVNEVSGPNVISLGVSDHLPKNSLSAILDAAKLAGLPQVQLFKTSDCLRSYWLTQHTPKNVEDAISSFNKISDVGEEGGGPCGVSVVLVDVGYSQTSAQLFTVTKVSEACKGDEVSEEKEGGTGTDDVKMSEVVDDSILPPGCVKDERGFKVTLISSVSEGVGVVDMINAVCDWASANLPAGEEAPSPSSKRGRRLALQCQRAVKDLSGLPQTAIDIEAFLKDENNLHLPLSRSLFDDICNSVVTKIQSLLSLLKEPLSTKSSTTSFMGVDVVGGGSRIPLIQKIIENEFSYAWKNGVHGDESCIRKTLDGSSGVAIGAGTLSAGAPWARPVEVEGSLSEEQLEVLSRWDTSMEQVERSALSRRQAANEVEEYLLKMLNCKELRDVGEVSEISQVRDAADLSAMGEESEEERAKKARMMLLCEEDKFFQSIDDLTLTAEHYRSRLKYLNSEMQRLIPFHFERVRREEEEREKSIKEAAVDKPQTDGDFDTKLPTSHRLKKAKKNKEEGNELFKGGNTEAAAKYYINALNHTNQIFDASADDDAEKKAINLSCHLNLANCYLKLGGEAGWKKAVASASCALELDENNAKAIYRRALGYFSAKKMDEAHKDIKRGLTVAPDDAAMKQLNEKIQRALQQQKQKEKQMYGKMFG
eukprot:GHVN01107319.1.p1 GENE.GHVN01107319.1~~GHVN01107319.1.p1  ORF type:complete len:878 (-),score=224.90 GHVN01107319.1:338-2971(-)